MAQVAAGGDTDVVVNALVGYAGLAPTVAALGAGKKLALANKESLVVGGEYVMRLAAEKRAPILPIDSEHSAIFQCLVGEQSPIRRLIITCSGGAFRDLPCEKLADVTVEQALRHPQWEMGGFIAIGSIFPGDWNWEDFWLKTAFLSIILAVMNILPIPGLDGGHAIFTFWEMVTGRKVSDKVLEGAQYVGLVIILFLLLYANGNDIYRFFIK